MSPAFRSGLFAGLALCLAQLAWFSVGSPATGLAPGAFSVGLAGGLLLLILTRLLRQRHRALGGLSLGQGVGAGLYASFVAALVTYCFLLTYQQLIHPPWLDLALDDKVAQLRAQGLSELAVRAEIVAFRRSNSPLGLLTSTLAGLTLLGAGFSALITLLLRRTPSAPRP